MTTEDEVRIILEEAGLDPSDEVVSKIAYHLEDLISDNTDERIEYAAPEGSAIIPIRELEELLRVIRELKQILDEKPEKTGTDAIRFDELRQIDYRITEILIEHRI